MFVTNRKHEKSTMPSREQRDSFERLYRENQPKVYRLALSLAGNTHDAEDITQEAFFRAFRSYDSFRGESSFFTWVYRIALNVANDHLKQRTKTPIETLTQDKGFALEEIIDPNPAANPETELLARQVRVKCLHAMTECLPLDQRKVFCLAITLGLPHKAVAELLDCSIASVKTTLHRAKKRWCGYMENKCGLIKRSNPCTCGQYVRFGLSQGWFKTDAAPAPAFNADRARNDVLTLRAIRDLYQGLFTTSADDAFVERVRCGIQRNEWSIFS